MADWALCLDETGLPGAHHEPLLPGQTPIFTLAGSLLLAAQVRLGRRMTTPMRSPPSPKG